MLCLRLFRIIKQNHKIYMYRNKSTHWCADFTVPRCCFNTTINKRVLTSVHYPFWSETKYCCFLGCDVSFSEGFAGFTLKLIVTDMLLCPFIFFFLLYFYFFVFSFLESRAVTHEERCLPFPLIFSTL